MSRSIRWAGLPIALAMSAFAVVTPASALVHPDAVNTHSSVAQAGVVLSVSAKRPSLVYRSDGTKYAVLYTSKTVWSAGLKKILKTGWHIIVAGQLSGSSITATKIFNNPAPERAACESDAKTVDVAVSAYEAINPGKAPPTVASLTSKTNGGPYLRSVPGNRSFYRIALNWGGAPPGKENGGTHPGVIDVAPVWNGAVGTYVLYDTEGAHKGCNAAS